jgi:hypothetical protein
VKVEPVGVALRVIEMVAELELALSLTEVAVRVIVAAGTLAGAV